MRAVALLLVAVTACAYDAPWTPKPYGPDTPFDPGSPGRVTINVGVDRTPAWLPGDSALLYSVERTGDHDRCLGVLSARTWTLRRTLCHGGVARDSIVDAFEWPGVRSGSLAFQWGQWAVTGVRPMTRRLMVAAIDRWDHGRVLLEFLPYGAGLEYVDGVRNLQWLSDTSLVYVHEQMHVYFGRPPDPPVWDTVFAVLDVERIDFGSSVPVVTVVPGTAGATSLAVNDSATAIYYTLPGDSLVYRLPLDAAVASIAYAFPGGVFPMDVQVRGERLVAAEAGELHLVDLQALTDSVVTGPGVAFSHPALSRDGHLIVVEGDAGFGVSDLWRVTWP
jgi:hypothetical protein